MSVHWPWKKAARPTLIAHRHQGSPAAVVFLHGFFGHPEKTWGLFPTLMLDDRRLDGWDLFSVGYSTDLQIDIPAIWTAAPDLPRLARLLRTVMRHDEALREVQVISIVAHSMGGLVVQRALVDDPELARRTHSVILFGTPSGGLFKAILGRFLKRQVRDMARDSSFITRLRADWLEKFGATRPFRMVVTAGDRDEFVPSESAWTGFADETIEAAYGDHLSLVKPDDRGHLSYQILANALTGDGAAGGPYRGARIALERQEFETTIGDLWEHRSELDDAHAVTLALALEGVGRTDDAIALMESHKASGTDPAGVLAGRLKRRWQATGIRADHENAERLYRQAFTRAEAENNHAQAFYQAINIAFLLLVARGDDSEAKLFAQKALRHCGEARDDYWKLATQAEARLILGEEDEALALYRTALEQNPRPREIDSTYQQALRIAEQQSRPDLVRHLASIFRPSSAP